MNSPKRSSFSDVRDDILGQHAGLRVLLAQLDATAERVVRSDRCVCSDLDRALETLVRELANHLAFEEAALSALSGPAGGWHPDELTRLGREHERQREELARITREACGADDPISLALAVRAFVADVLLDMTVEEDRLRRLDVPEG